MRCKLSDGKIGYLSTKPNNNISHIIPPSYILFCVKISVFKSKQHHLRDQILLYFISVKKSVVELHRLLIEVYREAALSETMCRAWFPHFKSGDFDVEGKERAGRPKLDEDAELETLLDENPCQTKEELAKSLGVAQSTVSMRLKTLEIIQVQGNCVLYELQSRDLERRIFTCEQLLQRQKQNRILHHIVTGDEK